MGALPTTGEAVRQHSAVALFRAIRQVITYKKLARLPSNHALLMCTNQDMYCQLNPNMSEYFQSQRHGMEGVLRDWCYVNRINMARLGFEEGIGMVIPGYVLGPHSVMAYGDHWELTEDAQMLITNLRTNEAIDDHVACALRGLEQDS